jgi:GDPmannose 4,6-dehydratase
MTNSENRTALITGINGQDGSYLSELLLSKGYTVHGTVKRNSVAESQTTRIEHIRDQLSLHYADLTDISSLMGVISHTQPDEIYNLAAQSHVRVSFDQPIYTAQATGVGVLNMLEAIRQTSPHSRLYQASSSEMFGNNIDDDGYQRETTSMSPVSPYGCAKVYAYNICCNYRNSYDMHVSNGILFNHESPRRGTTFVTNKVAKEAVKIKCGLTDKLVMGNMDATRDWGHAKDYVEAMWLMLQQNTPDDYVCATGVSHSVQQLVDYVFKILELDVERHVTTDARYERAEELKHLRGDSSKAYEQLGWKHTYTFDSMMDEMVEYWMDQMFHTCKV